MPKRTRPATSDSSNASSIESSNLKDDNQPAAKRPATQQTHQQQRKEEEEKLLVTLPTDLRTLLTSLPRRFMAHHDFSTQLKLLPHALALEVLDGLPRVDLFSFTSQGSTKQIFNKRELLGRFQNASERRFVLVRRNVRISAEGVSKMLSSVQSNTTTCKRSFAMLLRSVRHIEWVHNYDTNISNTKGLVFVDKLFCMDQVRRNLKSVKFTTDGAHEFWACCLESFPASLLPFVTSLKWYCFMPYGSETRMVFPNLHSVKAILARDDLQWLPFSKLRSLDLNNTLDFVNGESTLTRLESESSSSLQSIGLYFNLAKSNMNGQFYQLVHRFASKIARLTLLGKFHQYDSLRVDFLYNLHNVTRLRLEYVMLDQTICAAIRGMNERGQLISLILKNMKMDRPRLESLGIGHPQCALRELVISSDYSELSVDLFVPVLRCQHLETVSTLNFTTTKIEEIAKYVMDKGLLVECMT